MEASQNSSPRKKTSFIGGSQPLWKAFWILYILGSLSLTAIALSLIQLPTVHYALLQASYILNLHIETTLILTASAIAAAYVMYFVFCSISIWRCSRNTMKKHWAVLAKLTVSMHFSWICWHAFLAFNSLLTYFSHPPIT